MAEERVEQRIAEGPMGLPTKRDSSPNGDAPAGRKSIPVDWEALARVDAHPIRLSILEVLGIEGARTLSPSDLSVELQLPLSNVNYHVTELAKARLIVLVDEHGVRGATEHFYRLLAAVP